MSASPANEGATNVSLSCSLPSTPLFPPLIETLSHVTAKSGGEEKQRENCTPELPDHVASEAQGNGSVSAATGEGQRHHQPEGLQMKKDGLEPKGAAKCKVRGRPNGRAPRLGFGSTGMPSSLLRPLDHEEERKLLQLEEQFRKERMEMLRRQNVLRRRHHAEKQQELSAAAAREQAAALQSRHQKLQAARILMERGLAAAAAATSVEASTAANQSDAASNTAGHAHDNCCAHPSMGMTSAVVGPTAPAICFQHREMYSCGAAAVAVGTSRTTSVPVATSDSLPICHATCEVALSSAAKKKSFQQRSARQRCPQRHTPTSSSEHSGWARDVNFSHTRTPTPPDKMTGNEVSDTVDTRYTHFPDVSTVAECVVAGAAVRYKGAADSAGGYQPATGYHCQAAQEILSLWPRSRRTLLNAAFDNGGGLVILQNQNINRLVMAASISSNQRADHTCSNPTSSVAPPCDRMPVNHFVCPQQGNAECGDLPGHPALYTRKAHALGVAGDKVALTRSSSTIFQIPTCCPSDPWGQSQNIQHQAGVYPAPGREPDRQQQHETHQQQNQQQASSQAPRRHGKTCQQRCREKRYRAPWQQGGELDLHQPHPSTQAHHHRPNQPQAASSGCLTTCGDAEDGRIPLFPKHGRKPSQSQNLQVQSWHSQSFFSSPAVLGAPLSGSPRAQHDEVAPQRENTGDLSINRIHVDECSPCDSTTSRATTDSARRSIRQHRRPEVQEQQAQLQEGSKQQHEGLHGQKKQMKCQQQQPWRSGKTRSSTSTRQSSYAGQFTIASRAKIKEREQIRRKSSHEAQELDCDASQRLPDATVVTGSPVSASLPDFHAGDALTYSSSCNLLAPNLLVPAAFSIDVAIPTPCGPHVALRRVVSMKTPSVSAGSRAFTTTETLQVGLSSEGAAGHKYRQKSASRPSGGAPPARPESSHRNSQRQQRQPGPQQQSYSQQLAQSGVHTTQDQHRVCAQNSRRICTGVQVVNRKLKALIEQQLQSASSFAAVAGRDQVPCLPTAARVVDSRLIGVHAKEGAGQVRKETDVAATDAVRASPTAKDLRVPTAKALGACSGSTAESMLLQQESSSHSNSVLSQSLSVDSEWSQQQLEQPELFSRDHQEAQTATLSATEQFQAEAFELQQQQRQFHSTKDDAEGGHALSCRPRRACKGVTAYDLSRDPSDASEGVAHSEAQREHLADGTGREGAAATSHGSETLAAADSLHSVNGGINCGQCAEKAFSIKEEQGEYLRCPTESDGSAHFIEKAQSDVAPCEESETSAGLAGSELRLERIEQEALRVRDPGGYSSKTLQSHRRRQRVEKGVTTAPLQLHDHTCPRVIRIRDAEALDTKDAQEKSDTTTFTICSRPEAFKKVQMRRRLSAKPRIWRDPSSGPIVSNEDLQHSEDGNEQKREESEETATEEEFSQELGIATEGTKLWVITEKDSPTFYETLAEGECSRCRSTFFAHSRVGLSCGAPCSSPTCVRTSTASGAAAPASTLNDCVGGIGTSGRRPASTRASQTVQRSAARTGGNKRPGDCATVDLDQFSVGCTPGARTLVRAAGDSLGREKRHEVCGDKGRSTCRAAPNLNYVQRQSASRRWKVSQEQQQQHEYESKAFSDPPHSARRQLPDLHRQGVPTSPAHLLQEEQGGNFNTSPPLGSHVGRTYADGTPQPPQQSQPGLGLQEINAQRQLYADPVSTDTCSCRCSESGPGGQPWEQQLHYGKENAAAERESAQVEQCNPACAKHACVRHTNIRLNSCSSGGRCKTLLEHSVARHSGATRRALATHNSRYCVNCSIRETGSSPRSSKSRSSSRDRSSSRSGSECLQRFDRRMSTSRRQRSSHIALTTGKKEACCRCAPPSPCMRAAPRNCSRPLHTVTSTTASGGKSKTKRAVRCESKQEKSCCGGLEGSMSNMSGSTCASAEDSLDSSTLNCTLFRRSSSKLPLYEPPARKSRPLRALSTQPIKKATPKKCDRKDLKLQALANAEKKLEERLLLLDVNQKTLNEHRERRKYLQQQLLQQQQQQLLEQQQQLQQQQLLTLVQYRSLSSEGELNPGTSVSRTTESALVETNTRGAAIGHQRQRRRVGNRASVDQAAGTSSQTHSNDVLRSNHSDAYSSTNNPGQTLRALQPGIQQMLLPLNNATSALLPTSAPFASYPSTPVSISLLSGPLPCTIPPTGSLRERTPIPTLVPMTLTAPLQGDVSRRWDEKEMLLSKAPLTRQQLPLKNAKTATVFPPLPRRQPDAIGGAGPDAPGAVTAATAAGLHVALDAAKLPRKSKAVETKHLQPSRRLVPTRALPPLRARSSSWAREPLVSGLLPRNV